MKKYLTTAAVLLIAATQVYSQKNKDALFLRNGSQIFGKMEQVNGNKISVRTSDGSLFVFDSIDVDHFVIHDNLTLTRKKQGFGFGAELGFLVGSQNSQYPSPLSLGVNGTYTFGTRYLAEAGTGIEIIGHTYAPFYGGFRYCFRESRTSPFIFARAGYMLLMSESDSQTNNYPIIDVWYPDVYYYTEERSYKGGPTATGGFGISFAAKDVEFALSFAYRHFRTKETVTTSTDATENFYYNYDRLEVKLGLRF